MHAFRIGFPLRARWVASCLAVLLAVPASVPAQQRPALTLQQAIDLALANAPSLAAREAAVQGASAAAQAAGRLPDPRLLLGVENVPVSGDERFSLTDDSMTMTRVGWMQEVPNAGKRKAQVEVARASAQREQAMLRAERQGVRRDVTLAWLDRYFAEQRLALFSTLERENQVLQDTIRARIAAGRALPADATMARLEAVELADRRDDLDRELVSSRAALRRWVGDAAGEALAGPPPSLEAEPARARAGIAHHVELAAYEPMAAVAAAEAREAEAARKGDWGWEVSYGRRGPAYSDMVSFQVSIELPLFASERRDPLIYAKRKEVQRVEAEREAMLRRHAEELEAQLAQQETLNRKLARLRDQALPLADERVRLQMASYQAGRADLGSVLAARRDRAEAQLKVIDTEAALFRLRAQLAYLLSEEQA